MFEKQIWRPLGAVTLIVGLMVCLMALVVPKSFASDIPTGDCTPATAWTEIVTDAPAYDETVFDHWQRYSWTGGPHAEDDPPAFPSSDWQPNVQGDPHGIGHAGAYYRSNGNSGKGDWFYLEAVTTVVHRDAITHEVDHPEVTCPTESTSVPTETTTEPTAPTTEPTSPTTEPTSPTTEPTTPTTEPTEPTTEPTLPTESTETPSTPTTAPTTVPTSPSTTDISTPTATATEPVVKTHHATPPSTRTLPNTGGVDKKWIFLGAWLILVGLFCTIMAGRKKRL